MKNLTAYHIFYQNKDFGKYHEIDILAQLASILFWKKNFGPVKLFCNKKFLKTLKHYGIDQYYDDINTVLMESIPYKEYLPKYWSFCKIYAIKYISQFEQPFVALDTDLWIKQELGLDYKKDLILYHQETFKYDQLQRTYVSPSTFLSQEELEGYNWDVLPTNAAYIYINNKKLVDKWYKWVLDIIEKNKDKPKLEWSADTVFIEQRILPVLADSMGLKTEFIFPSVYKTWVDGVDDLSEWEPKLDSTKKGKFRMENAKHVWGLKNNYKYKDIRNLILYSVMSSLNDGFDVQQLENKHSKLFNACYNIWKDDENFED